MRNPPLFVVCLMAVAGWSFFSAARAADEGKPLRVMSFNIRYGTAKDGEDRWEKRKDFLIETIQKFNPDLLGVQEALSFQVDELAAALKGYAYVGVGRDDGKKKGEYSALFYKTDRFEKIVDGTFWLSPTPEVAGSKGWDAALTRICTFARLKETTAPNESTILVANTHFDHVGVAARRESAKLIRQKITAMQPTGPAILTGDFNSDDDTDAYQSIVKPEGGVTLIDSYRETHPQPSDDEASFHAFKGGRKGKRIDFIFHTTDFKCEEAAIDHAERGGHYPSDHFPVTAVLERVAK